MMLFHSLVVAIVLGNIMYGSGYGTYGLTGITYNGNVNSRVLNTNSYQYWDSGKCIQVMEVSGKGVKDKFEEPCSGSSKLDSLTTDDCVIIGDPDKNAVSLYLDSYAKLNVVRRFGCTVRTYTTTDEVTTFKEDPVDETACTAIRKQMAYEIEKNRAYWEKRKNKYNNSPPSEPSLPPSYVQPKPTNTDNDGSVSSPTISIMASFLESAGPCKQQISVVGNGVKDTFVEDCTDSAAESVKNNGLFVYGDPTKHRFCLFSEKTSILIAVKNKVCIIKTYQTKYGETTSKRSPMSIGKCSQIRKRMSEALKSKSKTPVQGIMQIPIPVVSKPPVAIAPSVSPIVYPLHPTPPQAPLYPQPLTTYVQPSSSTPVSNPVNSIGLIDTEAAPTVIYRQAHSRTDNANFMLFNNDSKRNGHREQEIVLVGRGINDVFKDYQTKDVRKTSNGLALVDLTGDFGLFTDTWGVLWVVEKDKCFQRIYEPVNGQTKITSTSISADECTNTKDKLRNQLGGGTVTDDRERKVKGNQNQEIFSNNDTWENKFDKKMANWQKKFDRRMKQMENNWY